MLSRSRIKAELPKDRTSILNKKLFPHFRKCTGKCRWVILSMCCRYIGLLLILISTTSVFFFSLVFWTYLMQVFIVWSYHLDVQKLSAINCNCPSSLHYHIQAHTFGRLSPHQRPGQLPENQVSHSPTPAPCTAYICTLKITPIIIMVLLSLSPYPGPNPWWEPHTPPDTRPAFWAPYSTCAQPTQLQMPLLSLSPDSSTYLWQKPSTHSEARPVSWTTEVHWPDQRPWT